MRYLDLAVSADGKVSICGTFPHKNEHNAVSIRVQFPDGNDDGIEYYRMKFQNQNLTV